jgi:glycosyltransferase involved in cell wall biosynthesis
MKLSVVIPTYNRAFFLKETLESIYDQMRDEIEVVVSNNGSSDETLNILLEFSSRYPSCFSYKSLESNQGIDANILSAISLAKGEYIFLFSDDDLLTKATLARILEQIQNGDVDLICLNHFCFKNHDITCSFPPFLPEKKIEFIDRGEAFFKRCGLGFLSSLVIKRQKALKYLGKIHLGWESAHLEIAARVALEKGSYCIYRGDILVAGRSLETARYDLFKSCVFYLKNVYDEFFHEGLLTKNAYFFFIRKLSFKEIPRIYCKSLIATRLVSSDIQRELLEAFSKDKVSFFFIKILLKIKVDFLIKLINLFKRLNSKSS